MVVAGGSLTKAKAQRTLKASSSLYGRGATHGTLRYEQCCFAGVTMAAVVALWTTTVAMLVLHCQSRALAPALFIFGDSLVDVGNNNFLATPAKANFLPFGVNFRNHATGRFCDGMLIPDFIASYLGIPFPPAYFSLDLQSQDPTAVARGVNFGSASSGIFGWTGSGAVLPFREQVSLFRTVQFRLVRSYGLAVSNRLISKSIFYICTGNNDVNEILHIRNSLPALTRNALLLEFGSQIRRLYDWGARKFVIVGVSAVGCVPMNQIYGRCSVSGMASSYYYNNGLSAVLSYLRSMLPGAHIVTADLLKLMLEVKADPEAHGFTNSYQGCCPMTEPWRWCYNYAHTCPTTHEFMFWDLVHPTQAFNRIAAQKWWNGSLEHISPMNISKLVNL